MANTILMKNRASDTTVPTPTALKQGELAVNSFDGSIFMGTKLGLSGSAGVEATASTRVGGRIYDEDDLSTNSATGLASQQSIKAYVDSSAGLITGVTAGTGLTGGGSSGDITLNAVGGTGLATNANDLALSHLGIESLSDPDADRIMFWDDSATAMKFLTAGSGLSISGTTITATDTQPLTTEQVQDIVGGMVTGNTETNIAVTYEDGDGTLDFVAVNDAVRTVTAGGNTLATSETLAFTAGTNMTISESGGAVTLTAPVRAVTAGGNSLAAGETLAFTAGSNITITESGGAVTLAGTADNQLTTEQVQDIVGGMVTGNTETNIAVTYEDGDGTLDFVATDTNTQYTAGDGLTLNTLDFDLDAALTTVTSVLNNSLKIGRADGQDSIDFGSDDTILFDVDNTERMRVDAAGVDITGNLTVSGDTTVVNILAGAASNSIQFEGSSADEYETTLSVVDPTADRTINLPNASGTVSLSDTNTTYTAGNGLLLSGTTFTMDDPANGTSIDEGTIATDDRMPVWDESASSWKYVTIDNLQDEIDTDTDTNTWRGVTAGGNTLASNETLAFTAGTNVTITESGGAVTLAAPVRAVTAGGNSLAAGETLAFTAGTGVSITESGGAVTINGTAALTTEQVQDIVGGMVTGNTETNIAVTYEDGDGTLDFVATDSNTNQLTTFTLAGDSGSSQTIAQGNTLTVAGGTGLASVASSTDTITLNIDSTVCTLTGTQTLTNKTIDAGTYTT